MFMFPLKNLAYKGLKPPNLYLNYLIALKFDRHLSSTVAKVPAKFQKQYFGLKYQYDGFETFLDIYNKIIDVP